MLAVATAFLGCANTSSLTQEESTAPTEAVLVTDRPFEMDTLYSLLVAEMAGDRQRFDIMLSNYVQQAEATRDVGVAARATRLARYLNAHSPALEMALLWTELDPDSAEAHYTAAAELVIANRLLEAVPHSTFLLERSETAGFDAIGARALQGGDIAITQQLLDEYNLLITKYPNNQPLNIGISLLYQHAGNLELALAYSQKAINIDPEDFQAKAQETRLLQQLGRSSEALSKLNQLVEDYPTNNQLRLQYARSLLKTDLTEAQNQFELLLAEAPNNPELRLTLALIKYERGMLEEAKALFTQLENNPRHGDTAHFYLGRIELTHKNDELAIDQLRQVTSGVNYLPALSLICDIFVSKNEANKAFSLIDEKRQNSAKLSPELLQGLTLLESRIFTAQGKILEAIEVLKQGIDQFPDASGLIYSRAMLFTRIDEIHNAEFDLKRVLALAPDNAAALNALGYTLADRTDRLEEAYQYIQKAYALTPDDPAVLDSLGWVQFRRGFFKQALESLGRAMEAMPDHEIAAHLGEVLWVTGNTTKAKQVWNTGLTLNPKSSVILDTMKRLQAPTKE